MNLMTKRRFLSASTAGIALAGLLFAGASQPVFAATPAYPEKGKTIQIIVPFGAGGSTDVQTRIIAEFMSRDLGANIEVVARPGAGSQIGLQQLATAKPDGYTIGITNNPTSMGVYLMPSRKATFNRASFAPIGLFVFDPETIAVKADGPYKTFKDLIDAARAKPRTIRATTNGMFSDDHMAIATVQKALGIQFATVHYDGSAEEVVALLGGKSDAAFMGIGATLSQVKAGTMRHIAVMDDAPNPILPGVPTLKSLGVDFVIGSSRGLSAPAGTPKEIIAVLEASLAKAMKDPVVVQKITGMGTPIRYLNAADFAKFWADMETRIRPTIDMMLQDQGIEEKGTK
jgi:tripartite-type tricarboxylate transporter receptor subunit TctC